MPQGLFSYDLGLYVIGVFLTMEILFEKNGSPYSARCINKCLKEFGKGYNSTVSKVIANSNKGLDKDVFRVNVGVLMPNFLMCRAGPFKGVKYSNDHVLDPNGIISDCWKSIGDQAVALRDFLDRRNKGKRTRTLLNMSISERSTVAAELWKMFKALLPVCMGKQTMGLVGTSKVLFAVLPEVALPVDNAEWRHVFKTVDFSDVVLQMAAEIVEWENETGKRLDQCDSNDVLTLPGIYNVMAMKARPK